MDSFARAERAALAAKIERVRNAPEAAPMIAEAKFRGYRLATVSDRGLLDPKDLFSWRGNVWVVDDAE